MNVHRIYELANLTADGDGFVHVVEEQEQSGADKKIEGTLYIRGGLGGGTATLQVSEGVGFLDSGLTISPGVVQVSLFAREIKINLTGSVNPTLSVHFISSTRLAKKGA